MIPDSSLIVLEYLAYGNFLGYLRKSRGIEDIYNTGEKGPSSSLREKDILSPAWIIADGMNYLASMKVNLIFFEIKRNLFIPRNSYVLQKSGNKKYCVIATHFAFIIVIFSTMQNNQPCHNSHVTF